MKQTLLFSCLCFALAVSAQNSLPVANVKMTPELLWKLGRVSGQGISKDKKFVVYSVATPDVAENKISRKTYRVSLEGGDPTEVSGTDEFLRDDKVSSDGKYRISSKAVPVLNIKGSDSYSDLKKSNVYVYTSLNFRHWDTWEDGKFDHVFLTPVHAGEDQGIDIMRNEPYDCPTKPSGGDEDFIWNPDGKHVVYVTKKKFGTDYAISTNTDLYEYDVEKGTTRNVTEANHGYDVNPAYSNKGTLAWLQMKTDGYEADKQDLVLLKDNTVMNLTRQRDDIHVESFQWSDDGNSIFFIAPVSGTLQLFSVNTLGTPSVRQLTKGDFDISGIVGQSGDALVVAKNDMNHATELYKIHLSDGRMLQLTHVNDNTYRSLSLCRTERRSVTTTDSKNMLVWVIYPPDFDPMKKYPTLLYCQGGPQSPQTQSYSFRWNFQLMASQGYIVVAPCRRGMPGFGTKWNEQISKDWGGQALKDLLSSIDAVSKEPYVDKSRRGCVGASFGGFAVYALEGMHDGRFKTFIAHDGVFDFRSMYGTTDEMWFENWEKGGNYWDKNNPVADRSFSQSPNNFIAKWNTPIMIVQGGHDYRVPVEQGLEAFKAAQLKGIKSKLVYLPEENHWVLSPQNAMVWQREFYKWLDETLK